MSTQLREQRFVASRYNFAVESVDGEAVVFNTLSGAVVRLGGTDAAPLIAALEDPTSEFTAEQFPPNLLQQLLSGDFLHAPDCDEVAIVRARYWRARGEAPMVLTITTTMDCNLGCYYCYEERSGDRLAAKDIPAIVALAEERLVSADKHTLHVDWYGGEPLLNLPFLESASDALQALCTRRAVGYSASIISNGSEWPDDAGAFVARNKIRQIQISFDGLKDNHDRRRHYRKAFRKPGASSFDKAVALVDALVCCARVDLRFNIDRGNANDIMPFIRMARERGWFAAPYPAVFQPARLSAYSGTSQFMREHQLSLEEFDTLRAAIRAEIGDSAKIEESEVPDGFPYPKSWVCGALAGASIVVGAEGLTYRCGLQVGERDRAVGEVRTTDAAAQHHADASWWDAYDPTQHASCSRCSFLPVCWGGCPKKHLEGDSDAIREQGRYWRNNLPRLIQKAAGFAELRCNAIPESLQFR